MLTTILVAIVVGAIIGALARFALPGRQNISIPVTIGLGILGSLAGSWIFTAVSGKSDTKGIDWIALIIGVIIAAVLIVAYERFISGRGRTRV